ncbi:MAG TPA: hypothetical protein PKN61_05515, partial [Acidobacteriota bacterium]|nr:hypothetical protein [Acidobacteriota bacterium]
MISGSRLVAWMLRLAMLGLAVMSMSAGAYAEDTSAGQPEPVFRFSGRYADLVPVQQRLLDDWLARFSQLTGTSLPPPEEIYERVSISNRATFEAITHALINSTLTDESGASLGNALDLVLHMETVRGQMPGIGGDLQFRMYARLRPDALDILHRCREFKRGPDNVSYHKGYPQNFRQQGGVPSIQISVTADGHRADVDVDYRSAKFPAALFNGHLSSANSDVRAGDNAVRHNTRWSGLTDWWRNLFGLPFLGAPDEDTGETLIPKEPRAGRKKIPVAVKDFLSAWLVEQRPELSMAYYSNSAFPCYPPDEPGQPVDFGMVPFRILKAMAEAVRVIGKVPSLSGVVHAVRLDNPRLQLVKHDDRALFSLYRVPTALGEVIRCEDGLRMPPDHAIPTGNDQYGRFYASAFYLSTPTRQGAALYMLWEREDKNWKIVAFKAEPDEAPHMEVPDLRPAAAPVAVPEPVAGDPGMITAATDFFAAWFLDRDFDRGLRHIAPRTFPCLNYFLPAGTPPLDSSEAFAGFIRASMARVCETTGPVTRLEDALHAATLANPGVQLVRHDHMRAFTIFCIPDHYGDAFDCSQPFERDLRLETPPDGPTYGNCFGTAFSLKVAGAQPAVTYLVWRREGGAWKII